MKLQNIYLLIAVAGLLATCSPEQEVEPVDPISDKPLVTITPLGDYSSVAEGDVLTFEISLDKAMRYPLTFSVVLADGSTADDDDFVSEGATLAAFSKSTTIEVLVAPDGAPEEGETLAFNFLPDFHWDWQVNTEGIQNPMTASVKDLTFSLDWSAGTYEDEDLCEAEVDLDLVVLNDAGTAGTYAGATGACPAEYSNFGLSDDSYNIYVQYYDSAIPALADVAIPYVVSFKGGAFAIEGSFNSDDAKKTTHYVGRVVIANGTYTVYDDNDVELGTL